MLHVHSQYSFRYGILSPEQVLEQAAANDYDVVALADINSTSALLHFVQIAQKRGIKPVVGIDFRNGAQHLYTAYAKNNEGFTGINAWLSQFLHSGEPIPADAPEFAHVVVVYPFSAFAERPGHTLRPNEYMAVHPRDLIRFSRSPFAAAKYKHKVVMGQRFTFAASEAKIQHNMHRLLRAVDNNCLLSKLPKTEEADPGDVWMHRNELMALYNDYPQIIANTTRLLQGCNVHFEYGDAYPHKNLRAYTPLLDPANGSLEADEILLRKLCQEHIHYRYPEPGPEVLRRLEMELEVIAQKQFVSYFLINWDITSYARRMGYFYVGRGSGANSLVAYILRITDVDPVELDLYFERFINLYRKNPPDFDLDFSWRDRPDITRYIFERFPHCAILGTYNTFQYRAVVRELGKVFGLPKEEIDVLSDGKYDPNKLDKLSQLVLRYGQLIQDFPSHLSLHAGGILIADAPIHQFSPTWMPPKGFPTVQFDMIVAEDIGLYKFDILGQRGLGKIKDAIEIIAENQPDHPPFDIHDLKRFKQDEAIRALLREGDALGCFYVESPAMRMLMKKLRVDNYLGLVAASSVIRPGVARSGMMREFILRYRFPERRKEAHPTMLEIMPETYGVMVYQEDVIKVAHYFAGLSLGEADVLRRGMSGKFRSREEFAKAKGKFFSNCKKKGYTDELTAEVWRQVESFAGYAFAKGHSASYAVESYQSLFLKAHYPLEYMVATLNNGGGFYSREHYLHEARMKGATIVPPCVNRASNEASISGKEIMLGFGFLQGLEDETVHRIVRARGRGGPFAHLDDFLDRVTISVEQIDILIRINAFRFTGRNKRELLWEARFKINPAPQHEEQQDLFREPRRNYTLPRLTSSTLEDAFDQMELLGFPLCSPFELCTVLPENMATAQELPQRVGQRVTACGYLVTAKTTSTVKGDRMAFGNFVDVAGRFIDTVHFPPVLRQYPFRGRGVYTITGTVSEEFDCVSIEVEKMERVKVVEDARYRDVA
jgi:DNA polymerase-3 subunit alpha